MRVKLTPDERGQFAVEKLQASERQQDKDRHGQGYPFEDLCHAAAG
jgi:hypothetical protein